MSFLSVGRISSYGYHIDLVAARLASAARFGLITGGVAHIYLTEAERGSFGQNAPLLVDEAGHNNTRKFVSGIFGISFISSVTVPRCRIPVAMLVSFGFIQLGLVRSILDAKLEAERIAKERKENPRLFYSRELYNNSDS